MDILDLFSYQANLNSMLARMNKALSIEVFFDIHLYEGVVEVTFLNIASKVNSFKDVKNALLGDADYYLNSNPEIELDSAIISEIMEELDFSKIDATKTGDFKQTRYDTITLIDDDTCTVDCSFSLEIIDI